MAKTTTKTANKGKAVRQSYTHSKRNIWLALVAILIISFIAYSKVFTLDFVSLDDTANILGNKQITSINLTHIKEVFSKTYVQMYAPLTMITYMIDYFFAGKLNPAVFHFFNLFYHLINILLVFIFIKKLIGNNYTALIAALLFGIHPLNVEVVAWISTRSTLLFVGFGLLAMIYYIRYHEKNFQIKYLLLSCLFFILSLLSKSSFVMLPLLLLAIDYYKGRKFNPGLIYDKLPFVLLSAVFIIITLHARSNDIGTNQETYSLIERLLFANYGVAFYFIKLILPVSLSVIHPFPPTNANLLPAVYYLSLLIIPLFLLFIFKSGKMKKDILFGMVFFVINLLLVLQILPYGYSVVCERYVYLPYLGLFLIIGQFFTGIHENRFNFSRKIKPFIIPLILFFAVVLTILTYNRTEVWKNPMTLSEDTASKQPDSYYAIYSRGVARILFHDNEGAMNDYNMALKLNPLYAEAYSAKGLLLDNMDSSKRAVENFNKALTLAPYLVETYYDRGNSKLKSGDYDGAIKDYNIAINKEPEYDAAICNRGTAWLYLNDLKKACNDWTKAASLGNSIAVSQLGKHCK